MLQLMINNLRSEYLFLVNDQLSIEPEAKLRKTHLDFNEKSEVPE